MKYIEASMWQSFFYTQLIFEAISVVGSIVMWSIWGLFDPMVPDIISNISAFGLVIGIVWLVFAIKTATYIQEIKIGSNVVPVNDDYFSQSQQLAIYNIVNDITKKLLKEQSYQIEGIVSETVQNILSQYTSETQE